jgi:hypothetical protein
MTKAVGVKRKRNEKKNDKEIYLYHLIEKRQIGMGLYKERR